jgi:hypothetical protein
VNVQSQNAPYKECSGCQDLGETIGRRGIPGKRLQSGKRRLSNHLYWECRKQYGLLPQKPAWQFWKCIFRKIEQVKDSPGVLKFLAPKKYVRTKVFREEEKDR